MYELRWLAAKWTVAGFYFREDHFICKFEKIERRPYFGRVFLFRGCFPPGQLFEEYFEGVFCFTIFVAGAPWFFGFRLGEKMSYIWAWGNPLCGKGLRRFT